MKRNMTSEELEREIERVASENPEISEDLSRLLMGDSVEVSRRSGGRWVRAFPERSEEDEYLRSELIKLAFEKSGEERCLVLSLLKEE